MPQKRLIVNSSSLGATAALLLLSSSSSSSKNVANADDCGLWLGPSPIKEAEDHGWGHSIFTGKLIKKGQIVLGSGILDPEDDENNDMRSEKIFGDLFIPIYDWETLDTGRLGQERDDDDDHFPSARSNPNKKKPADTPTNDKDNKEGLTRGKQKVGDHLDPHDPHSIREKYTVHDPPLFEELWNGDFYHQQVLESFQSMKVFVPGLANIAPCTSENFNLEQKQAVTYRDWRSIKGEKHDESPPSHQAGSFSYWSNAMFVASRDIQPGEELVVECADNSDEFNPKDYPPVKFTPKEAGGYSICLDDKVEERLADHTPNVCSESSKDHESSTSKADLGGGQRGLFAKKTIQKGEILTSSPMIPVHRNEMDMNIQTDNIADDTVKTNRKQLMMNYLYGHPESSLMWLPTTALLHAVNHATASDQTSKIQPNAKITWHHDEYDNSAKTITRRQRFHHLELLEMNSLDVTKIHGMGLMMDLVATRTIYDDEEILIDYGDVWNNKWVAHKKTWNAELDRIGKEQKDDKKKGRAARQKERELKKNLHDMQKDHPEMAGLHVEHHHKFKEIHNAMTSEPFSSYVTASDYNEMYGSEKVPTITEQHHDPYPSNIQTACYFEMDWLDDDINEDSNAETLTYESWYRQEDHFDLGLGCFLPCLVMERRDYVAGEIDRIVNDDEILLDDDDTTQYLNTKPSSEKLHGDDDHVSQFNGFQEKEGMYGDSHFPHRYTVKLIDSHVENTSVEFDCHLYKRFDYIYEDMPREGIVFVNKPHSTDVWLPQAFREPIGVPDDMFPDVWKDLNPKVHKAAIKNVVGSGNMRAKNKDSKEPDDSPYTMFFPPKVNKFNKYVHPDVPKEILDADTDDEEGYLLSLKRWNFHETRRERLEELDEKNPPKEFKISPRGDL